MSSADDNLNDKKREVDDAGDEDEDDEIILNEPSSNKPSDDEGSEKVRKFTTHINTPIGNTTVHIFILHT